MYSQEFTLCENVKSRLRNHTTKNKNKRNIMSLSIKLFFSALSHKETPAYSLPNYLFQIKRKPKMKSKILSYIWTSRKSKLIYTPNTREGETGS